MKKRGNENDIVDDESNENDSKEETDSPKSGDNVVPHKDKSEKNTNQSRKENDWKVTTNNATNKHPSEMDALSEWTARQSELEDQLTSVKIANKRSGTEALSSWTAQQCQLEEEEIEKSVTSQIKRSAMEHVISEFTARQIQLQDEKDCSKTTVTRNEHSEMEDVVSKFTARQIEKEGVSKTTKNSNGESSNLGGTLPPVSQTSNDELHEHGATGNNNESDNLEVLSSIERHIRGETTARPGAVRVEGVSRDTHDEEDDEDENDDDRHDTITSTVQAENVDDAELTIRFRERARDLVREQLQQESALATEVSPMTTGTSSSTRRNQQICGWPQRWIVCIVGFIVTCVAVTVGVVVSSRAGEEISTNSVEPLSENQTDFAYMQDQILQWNISDEATIFDPTSAQYQALDWLVHVDPARFNVRDTELSILMERYVLAVLYYSTNGPEWTYQEGYLGELSVCSWHGIHCDVLDDIIGIGLGTHLKR